MILRNPADHDAPHQPGAGQSLRVQLAALAGLIVAIVILLSTGLAFWLSSTTRLSVIDSDLRMKSYRLASQLADADADQLRTEVATFRRTNPRMEVAASLAGEEVFYGDPVPVAGPFSVGSTGDLLSENTYRGERTIVRKTPSGVTVAVAQEIDPAHLVSGSWGAASLVVLGAGGLLAWASGALISAVGLRPVRRLHRAIDVANETEQPTQLPVEGDDEFAEIAEAVNEMIGTLEESKTRQAQLVADASHELKTPLTSMRTNIELLMMLYNSGKQDQISAQDRADLERDVLAQMEEMSILIGDLVDLARDEAHQGVEPEDFRLDEVLEEAVDRVRRRRPDVTFLFQADPWIIHGDRFAMGRAPLNLIDNAAKWSPEGGTVRVSLKAATRNAVLIVDDSGPGIAPEERTKVFERFYRAPESRSMPGSGLGLAIVKQVFDRHGATVVAEESDDGGARFRVVFPGRSPENALGGEGGETLEGESGAVASTARAALSSSSSRVIPKKSYS